MAYNALKKLVKFSEKCLKTPQKQGRKNNLPCSFPVIGQEQGKKRSFTGRSADTDQPLANVRQ
jgi:hypothetical protein